MSVQLREDLKTMLDEGINGHKGVQEDKQSRTGERTDAHAGGRT